jgi:hypothetical protein
MEDEKLDLSSLDPARDREAWQRRVDDVIARGVAARRERSLGAQLLALARPAVLLAAAVVLLVWSASWLAPRAAVGTRRATLDPTARLVEWSTSAEPAATSEILATLGGDHGAR